MRLAAAGLLLSVAALGSAFHLPSQAEKVAAWNRLNTVKALADGVPKGMQLVLVNPIWRHGDRGPTEAFEGDVLKEDDWDFGGGGYGELSPIGMRQHFELGQKLFDRYAAGGQFLSERYRAKEIYARSTDRNRTLVSAMSNFNGMYSRASAKKGTDYPDLEGWPSTFVPVPIHTENRFGDHVGDPDADCDRQDDLWALAHSHPEYVNYEQRQRTVQTLSYLMDKTGGDSDAMSFDNVYILRQGMLCESIHFPDNFSDWYPWYTEDVKQRVSEIDDQNIDFQNGIYGSGWVGGYDLTLEIPMIRGGPLINDVLATARGVLDCYATNTLGESTRCTDGDHFLSNLKYYVVSGHDTTIAAYLTVLEAKPQVLRSGGYPSYSAAVITEFFIDTSNGANERYFRVLFHDDEESTFRVITPFVSGCEIGEDFCRLSRLQALADKYAPPGGIDELCAQRITGPAVTTTVAPPPPPPATSAATTKKADDNDKTTVTVPAPLPTTSTSSPLSLLASAIAMLLAKSIF